MKLEQVIQSDKFDSQVQKAGINILYSAWWLKTLISQRLKALGITQEQFNVLRILKGKHPEQMCVRDIGCRMIEKNSNVPRIIDRLELKKLAERSVSLVDKRETVITITPAGIALLKQASQHVADIMNDTIAINEEEAKALNSLLEKMREKE